MMLALTYTLICIILHRIHANMLLLDPPDDGNVYFQDILNNIQDRWLRDYTAELFSVCTDKTRMCSKTILKGNMTVKSQYLNDASSCCVSCSCSESCAETNTCCIHIKTTDISEQRKYEKFLSCINPYRYENKSSEEYERIKDDLYGHLVVSSCPRNTNIEEKFICEDNSNDIARPLVDTVPVTIVSSGVHFANKYCAACHGIKEDGLVLWNIKISCLFHEELTLDNLKSVMAVRDDCFLQYTPPKSAVIASEFSKCRLDIVRSCNESGAWEDYNKQVEDFCTNPFLEEIHTLEAGFGKVQRYKNVFCAICNGEVIDGRDCRGFQFPSGGHIDFKTILSFSEETPISTYNNNVCPLGHTFISLKNDCRMTYCASPLAVDILHNTCIPPDNKAFPVAQIDLALKVTIDKNLSLSSRAEIENEIIKSLSIFYTKSHMIIFAYELKSPYDRNRSNVMDILYETFNVVYVYIPVYIQKADHQMAIAMMNTLPLGKNVSINGSELAMVFSHYDSDPAFVASFIITQQEFLYIQNPYSKAAIVKYPASPSRFIGIRIYPVNFMDCPSVLISLQELDAQRYEHGLKIGKTGRHIEFSQFKSLNTTHVFVCHSALAETTGQSSAGSMTYSLNWFHFTLFYFATKVNDHGIANS